MIKKYRVRINYYDYTYGTLSEAISLVKMLNFAEQPLDVQLTAIEVEGEPIAEAVRTGLNDDYPDNL